MSALSDLDPTGLSDKMFCTSTARMWYEGNAFRKMPSSEGKMKEKHLNFEINHLILYRLIQYTDGVKIKYTSSLWTPSDDSGTDHQLQ